MKKKCANRNGPGSKGQGEKKKGEKKEREEKKKGEKGRKGGKERKGEKGGKERKGRKERKEPALQGRFTLGVGKPIPAQRGIKVFQPAFESENLVRHPLLIFPSTIMY